MCFGSTGLLTGRHNLSLTDLVLFRRHSLLSVTNNDLSPFEKFSDLLTKFGLVSSSEEGTSFLIFSALLLWFSIESFDGFNWWPLNVEEEISPLQETIGLFFGEIIISSGLFFTNLNGLSFLSFLTGGRGGTSNL